MFSNACQIFPLLSVQGHSGFQIDYIIGIWRTNRRVYEPIVDQIANDLQDLAIGRGRKFTLQTAS
jgi:hypothetical protein